MQYRSRGRTVFQFFNYTVLLLTSLLCILPFVNMLAVSFSGSAAVSAGDVMFWPKDFTFQSYLFALAGGKFFTALWVSIQRVGLGVGLNLVMMTLAAYPLSKTKTQLLGRNIYMTFFVLTMFISGGMIPTYLVVVKAGLLDSIWSLILPMGLPVYEMIILMNFMRGLPAEIEEAATIDGASPFGVLTRVLLPLLKPALATVALFCVIFHWNDWFSGLIYMSSPTNYPLQTYLQSLLKNFEELMITSNKDYVKLLGLMNARTGRAAQLFLGAIPVMMLYPFLQKYFTTGLVLGSIKG